jgi:5,10-methylenetetrahydromethanopterin reductase
VVKVGIGLPGKSVADVRASAEAAAAYAFDSFSVYGDLYDLPPYGVLPAAADALRGTLVQHIGPLGVPVSLQHPELTAAHAIALEEQLPGQSSIGLVRGAFLESIGERPASLSRLQGTIAYIRQRFGGNTPPIYIGGFGPKILAMAGRLAVEGVKLGGSTNPDLATHAAAAIRNPHVEIVLGAVSVIDPDRKAARTLARCEVARYLAIVGELDPTIRGDELESLRQFIDRFKAGDPYAAEAISDGLLDKFALAGTADDALAALEQMDGKAARFEFGTPHGLGTRPQAIRYIGEAIVNELGASHELPAL